MPRVGIFESSQLEGSYVGDLLYYYCPIRGKSFIGRTDAEAEASILWPPDVKSRLTGKDPDAGETEGRRRRGQQD